MYFVLIAISHFNHTENFKINDLILVFNYEKIMNVYDFPTGKLTTLLQFKSYIIQREF